MFKRVGPIYLVFGLSLLLSTFVYIAGTQKVFAAGVSVSLSPATFAAATATDVTLSYVSSAEYDATNTVAITAPLGVTVAACTSPVTDSDSDSTADGSGTISGQTYTYTYTASTTTAATTGVHFCVKLTASTGNYNLGFTDSKTSGSNNDYGAALFYVGSANTVSVSAQVQPALSFVIRNSTDTGNTNVCALGTLSLTSVNTCSYRLKVTTNSASGYTISVNTDGDLRSSGSGNVADNLDLDIIADNGSFVAGTEAYGISLIGGSITGGVLTEANTSSFTFQTDASPLPISSVTTMITTNGTNNPVATDTTNTSLVTHSAAMDGDTSTGNYTQQVTYTVSASF